MFFSSFLTTFHAIVPLLIVAGTAAFAVKKGIVIKEHIQGLSSATVYLFLPCLIMTKTIAKFEPDAISYWWIIPLIGLGINILGILFCFPLFKLNEKSYPLWPVASIQNGIYLPLPLGLLLYQDQFDTFAIYCFLIIIGTTPAMWILGRLLLSGPKKEAIRISDFFTPPIIALLASIIIVITGLDKWIPGPVISAMDLMGQPTLPIAIFILGATLATINLADMPSVKETFNVAAIKFFLVPASIFGILAALDLNTTMPLFCSMMIIQAASPPATNLILIVKHYGGDDKAISSMMLFQHLICIAALPLWLALWQWFN